MEKEDMTKVKKLKGRRFLFGFLSFIFGAATFLSFLGMANSDPEIFTPILIISAPLWGIMYLISNSAKNKLRGLCFSCGSSISGASYQFDEVDRYEDSTGDVKASVAFSADCPNCGTEKRFTKKYTVYHAPRFDGSGRQTSRARVVNIQRTCEHDAKKYFGH
jgi:hypothetical protein